MRGVPRLLALLFGLMWLASVGWSKAALPTGKHVEQVTLGHDVVEVHYYKPANYNAGALLVSFHGLSRNVIGYVDATTSLADQHGWLVVAPLFDARRFPNWRYQGNGITRQNRKVTSGEIAMEPHAQWTSTLIQQLIEHVRAAEGHGNLPYYLLGHSAGAQIANRIAAFVEQGAIRVVVANPSSYVWPSLEERFPYGFGALPTSLADEAALRRYLAQPVTLFLGTADTKVTPDLDVLPAAMRQGANRHERGRNVFRAAQSMAHEKGWPFNWNLVEAPGVGHSAARMYNHPAAAKAFTPAIESR